MCLMVIHMNFLSSFPCQSVSIQSFLFSVVFFHSLLIFYISINKVSTRLCNRSIIDMHMDFTYRELSNPPVHNSETKIKFSFGIK